MNIFKNTASQKIRLRAFDATTGLPKTGDAANITMYVNLDWAGVNALADTSATEIDATKDPGGYLCDLAQGETNANVAVYSGKSTTANIVLVSETPSMVPAAFGLVAGATGGLFIAGSNAATTAATWTVTGLESIGALTVTGTTTLTGAITATNAGNDIRGVLLAAVQTFNMTGNITGSLSGSVGSVSGAVGSVTAAVTVGTNLDKTGYALSATGSAALTEGYRANGATGTIPQLLYEILAHVSESAIVGTTKTINKLDHATPAETFTLDSATAPTSITRAT